MPEFVKRIPRVARPFALIFAPLLVLHVCMPTPDAVPDRAHTLAMPSETAQAARELPDAAQAQTLIEHDDSFRAEKHAECTSANAYGPLCRALQKHEFYIPPDSDSHLMDVTPEARTILGGDLTVTEGKIDLVVARKLFRAVTHVGPPPQALEAPLRYATRVDFQWKWSATNVVSDDLEFLGAAQELNGVAYLQLGPDKQWKIERIDFNDPTPDFLERAQ